MIITKKDILNKFRTIFKYAMKTRQYNIAPHATVCQGKVLDMFQHQRLPPITCLKNMDQYQLQTFIEILEKNEFGSQKGGNQKESPEKSEKKSLSLSEHPPPSPYWFH